MLMAFMSGKRDAFTERGALFSLSRAMAQLFAALDIENVTRRYALGIV
jgi:hypothetical protein